MNGFAMSLGNSKHRTVLECMMDGMRMNVLLGTLYIEVKAQGDQEGHCKSFDQRMYSDELLSS